MVSYDLEKLRDKLERAANTIGYLEKNYTEGAIYKNENGRYCMGNHEYTSRSLIEVYDDENEEWIATRVEHNKNNYFVYATKKDLYEGMLVRRRD